MMKRKEEKKKSVRVVNKEEIERYIMRRGKYEFWVYEKGIVYRIVEMGEGEVEGVRFGSDCKKIEERVFDRVEMRMGIG